MDFVVFDVLELCFIWCVGRFDKNQQLETLSINGQTFLIRLVFMQALNNGECLENVIENENQQLDRNPHYRNETFNLNVIAPRMFYVQLEAQHRANKI